MVDITKYLTEDLVITDLKAPTKEDAIRALIDRIYDGRKAADLPINRGEAFEAVMERENLQTTGIGNGLAFPHARIPGWDRFSLAMGIRREGLDFASVDGQPAKFIFLLISSPEEPYIILQTMATLIRFVVEQGKGEEMLRGVFSPADVMNMFSQTEIETRQQILACDIARPVINYVTPGTSIEDATRIMHLNRFDALPVVDSDKKYVGEISCLNIFEYGMPDYFKKLSTISFVRHIDPFEKYFKIKGDLKVGDVCVRGESVISSQATLLEIIFEMTVKQKSKLFVLEKDNTLVGVVDRFCIIDKILFF